MFLAALKAGKLDRKSIGAFVSAYDAEGVTKRIKFTATGEVAGDAVYSYKVEGAKLKSLGIIK